MDETIETLPQDQAWTPQQLERAGEMGKWIWLLFWLIIPTVISNLMTKESVVASFPQLRLPGVFLSLLTVIAYGVILLILHRKHRSFLYAGFCMIVGGFLTFGLEAINAPELPGPWILVALPADILDLIAIYHEYHAHAAVLSEFDPDFAGKWKRLWYWYIGTFAAMGISLAVLLVSPMAGTVIMMTASLVGAVVTITKVIYLYRTAQIYRRIRASQES